MKKIICCMFAVILMVALSTGYSHETARHSKVIEGFSYPESIVIDYMSGFVFVSNLGEKLEPSAKDNDGFISRLSADGNISEKKYLPKKGVLNSPKGMAISVSTLFVADVDRVVGFDISTGRQNFELDFSKEKTMFLNDIAVIDNNTLFVSATDIGKIFKIYIDPKPRYEFVIDLIGANGLYFDKKAQKLYAVSFGGQSAKGGLGVISFENNKPKYEKLTEGTGLLDGVWLLEGDKILFSDWVAFDKPGRLVVYDLKTKNETNLKLPASVHGPADFFYDEQHNQLWLPSMQEGKVLVTGVDW